MTRNINEAADHYYDRLLAEQDEEEALANWLEENKMTMEQYQEMRDQEQEDKAFYAEVNKGME